MYCTTTSKRKWAHSCGALPNTCCLMTEKSHLKTTRNDLNKDQKTIRVGWKSQPKPRAGLCVDHAWGTHQEVLLTEDLPSDIIESLSPQPPTCRNETSVSIWLKKRIRNLSDENKLLKNKLKNEQLRKKINNKPVTKCWSVTVETPPGVMSSVSENSPGSTTWWLYRWIAAIRR